MQSAIYGRQSSNLHETVQAAPGGSCRAVAVSPAPAPAPIPAPKSKRKECPLNPGVLLLANKSTPLRREITKIWGAWILLKTKNQYVLQSLVPTNMAVLKLSNINHSCAQYRLTLFQHVSAIGRNTSINHRSKPSKCFRRIITKKSESRWRERERDGELVRGMPY